MPFRDSISRVETLPAAAVATVYAAGYDADLGYTPASGGVTYTLAAAKGTFVTTGNAAPLVASRKMAAAGTSFTTSVFSASLRAARRCQAATGVFNTTGYAAGLKAARVLTAASGIFVTTGRPATLTYPYTPPEPSDESGFHVGPPFSSRGPFTEKGPFLDEL